MTKDNVTQTNGKCNIEEGSRLIMNVPFFMSPNKMVDIEETFTGYEKLLYLILCRYGNNNTVAFPSLNTLVKKSGFSKPTVIKALNGLIEKGIIVKQTIKSTTGQYSRNIYHVKYNFPGGVVKDVYQGGKGRLPGVVKDVYPINNSFINKEREPRSNNSQVKEAVKLYKQLKETATVNQRDKGILSGLIKTYGLDDVLTILTFHVNEPDQWTKERGCSVSTINHNMPAYLEKLKRKKEEAAQQAKREVERQRYDEELKQQKEEQLQEETRRAALTAEQRRLEDIGSRRKQLKALIKVREPAAKEGDKPAQEKIKQYQSELQALAEEEAQLLPIAKEA